MKYVIGELYKIKHSRKGLFSLLIEGIDSEWITGTLVSGKIKYRSIFADNTEPGERITIRKSLILSATHEGLKDF